MAQLSDCFAFRGPLLTVDAARMLIGERLSPVAGSETTALSDADGRLLAQDIIAPIDLPPFDNSAVDGYAVRFDDLDTSAETVMRVQGRAAAGAPMSGLASGAVRIFTGAMMPPGFDTAFMQEDVVREGDLVRLPPGVKRGANRRLAGEDLAKGSLALAAGARLSPRELSLIASLGIGRIMVRQRLRVAVFSTGDEIAMPGASLAPGMLYDANRVMLVSLLRRLGCVVSDLGILPDRREAVVAALSQAAASQDLIITSGGVSTGEEDHIRAAMENTGSITFWRLAIKPGRPVAMGVIAGTPFVGLPGNPVAAFVTFVHVARALIARLAGEDWLPPLPLQVEAAFDYGKKQGRREYVRARLEQADGRVIARKHPREGIISLSDSDGLVELLDDAGPVAAGDRVGFLPFGSLF